MFRRLPTKFQSLSNVFKFSKHMVIHKFYHSLSPKLAKNVHDEVTAFPGGI